MIENEGLWVNLSLPIVHFRFIHLGRFTREDLPRANRVNSALVLNAVLSLGIDDQRAWPRLVAQQNLSKPMKFPGVLPAAITTDGNNNYISCNYCTWDSSAVRASWVKELDHSRLFSFLSFVLFFQTNKSAQIYPYFENSPCTTWKLRVGLWPYKISDSKNWNFREGNFSRERTFICFMKSQRENCILSVVHHASISHLIWIYMFE